MRSLAELEHRILEIVEPLDVDFGIALKVVETNEEWTLNGDRRFQLASIYKVPILVRALRLVDQGFLDLGYRIPLEKRFKTCPCGILVFLEDGLCPTLRDLLVLMITISDNTATDMVLEQVGGTKAVAQTLAELGFTDLDFSLTRSMHQMFADLYGPDQILRTAPERVARVMNREPDFESPVFSTSSDENVGSPLAMNRLYEMLLRGEAASRSSCEIGLGILLQQTLDNMMPNQLPPSTQIAHKTGGWIGVRNDSGIIFGEGGSHLLLTILTQRRQGPELADLTENTSIEKSRVDQAIGSIATCAVGFAASHKVRGTGARRVEDENLVIPRLG